MKTSLIIPAYNEREALPLTIDEYVDYADEIVVVDDGSKDGTDVIARDYSEKNPKVRYVKHAYNKGKPEALKTGANWYVVDATDQVLGRLATRVARVLIGKDKPAFTPYLDSGDHVIVINADKVRMTGTKIEQKVYYSHSGYPGGLKEVPVKRVRETRPEWVVREAIVGMLPKNKLRARRAKKLRVYRDAAGLARHKGQKPQALAI